MGGGVAKARERLVTLQSLQTLCVRVWGASCHSLTGAPWETEESKQKIFSETNYLNQGLQASLLEGGGACCRYEGRAEYLQHAAGNNQK